MKKPKLEDFKPQRRNANKHTPRGLGLLEKSINQNGWIGAMTAAADGEIFDGSARLETAVTALPAEPIVIESDGKRPIIVKRTDIKSAQSQKALRLSLEANRIAQLDLDWDVDVLAEIEASRKQLLEGLFSDRELAEIGLEFGESQDAEPQIDRAAELLKKWKVKTGDLWQIGEHRLICGDCTDAAVVERVMRGELVKAVLIDPPYQMGKDMENDSLDIEDFVELHNGFMKTLPLEKKATVICFHSPRTFPVALDAGRSAGLKFERMLYMTKPNDITFPWRGWLLKSEAILVFSVGGGSWVDIHPYTADTYLHNHHGGEINDGGDKAAHGPLYHPSIKPMEVVSDLLSRIGGDIIYDCFVGSGTTLVACQNLNRRGRAIEISPAYCAVTLERMATAFPGIEIKRLK